MSLIQSNRREFLRTTALAGAALTVPGLMPKARAAITLPNSEYFDLTDASTEFFRNVALHQTSGAMQSFAFNGGDSLYVLQTLHDSAGDLTLTRLDPNHNVSGFMTLTGAGHGVAMGIDNNGAGDDYYWTESEAYDDGGGAIRGRKLQRFTFSNGSTYSHSDCEVFDPTIHLEGSTQWNVTCSIDQKYKRIAVRYAQGSPTGSLHFNLYNLADFNAHNYTPYFSASIKQPAPPQSAGTPQGWCLFGSWIYLVWGTVQSTCPGTTGSAAAGGSVIGRFNLNNPGAGWSSAATSAGYSLCDREPEGIAVRSINGSYQLHLGLSGNSGNTGHYFSTYYKDKIIQP